MFQKYRAILKLIYMITRSKKVAILLAMSAVILSAGYFFIFRKNILEPKNITISSQAVEENKTQESQNEDPVQINDQKNSEPDAVSQQKIEDSVDEEKTQPNAQQPEKKDEVEKEPTSGFSIINKYVSWGYQEANGRKIDTIIIHSSYDAIGSDPYSLSGLISEYKQYGVSPHYLIDRKGNVYRLVAEKNIAYHAGESQVPDGRTGVNNFSIGIELMNKEDGKFNDSQYAALKNLIADIKSRYKIKYALGHNQIAPGRKTDPWNFVWEKL